MILKNSILKQYYRKGRKVIKCLLLLVAFNGCIEPYEGAVDTFDDVLVVSANITNEFKRQEVILTRSYRFEEKGPGPEQNANVRIVSSTGDEYLCEEVEDGKYLSIAAFAVQPNTEYSLSIVTEGGRSYASDSMQLPQTTILEDVYAEPMADDKGKAGIGIFIDSFDPTGQSRYYRYEYVETYKVIAPFWSPYDAVVLAEGEQQAYLAVILREREERVCYGTGRPKEVIIQSTLGFTEDRLKHFNIRFIEKDDYILINRYSILAKQYVQNPEAFSYYETLKGLSKASENVFSEDQPGFLAGNVFSLDDPGENVAGFFEVSSVDEKRIFFNYEDFFPGEEKPPYISSCFTVAPTTEGELGKRPLVNAIYDDRLRYYDRNTNPSDPPLDGPLLMVSPECGDCTTLGSNKVPDFWIE